MATHLKNDPLKTLSLPDSFEDLTGIVRTELKVIASALGERAGERLLLSHRQIQQLKRRLYNELAQTINETLAPLTVERQ